MTERLRVTPIEASVIILNEILRKQQPSSEIARALHSSHWKNYYSESGEPVRPEDFSQDSQRSELLLNAVDLALETLRPRERGFIKMRFGFDDGQLHTLKEIGEEFSLLSPERPRQIIDRGLRKLRLPRSIQYLVKLLS